MAQEMQMPIGRALVIEVEREEDGRWIAEVPALPGVLAYGSASEEARARAEALALRVMADRLAHGEPVRGMIALDRQGPSVKGAQHRLRPPKAHD
jgi:predicted RNase H-like HicB family nuclease